MCFSSIPTGYPRNATDDPATMRYASLATKANDPRPQPLFFVHLMNMLERIGKVLTRKTRM